MRWKVVLVLAVIGSMTLVACGDKDKDKDKGENPNAQPCLSTPSPIARPTFPAGFPDIGDVTWTASNQAGPSLIATGNTSDALDDLFNEMKEKFGEGGYTVSKSEHDPHDAEVNFTSEKYDGQVRLGEECQGRRVVTVTVRPKS